MLNLSYLYSFFFFLMGFMFVCLSMLFMYNDLVLVLEWELIIMNVSVILMALIFDWMSLIFSGFVLLISSMVIYYSNEYMHGDLNFNRFIILVILFVLCMIMLVLSPNLISLLLGWDGLGLISYCLVIYYQNPSSFNSGYITVLSNRVGDAFILMSISWMLNFGSWNYIYYYDFYMNSLDCLLISMMIMFAAMTKSAQIPFSAWLPAAMAAPTPVSALVHSSTLVTAGVYLLIRFNPMLIYMGVNNFLMLIGCLTMFMSGLSANYEFDLKKVIALSTLSQLGLMMGILSLGLPMLSFYHLLTHAMFKSLLFLCAGCYIHNLMDHQDIRFMGSLTVHMPYVSACFNISDLGLCGFPFLSGFYSKDLILDSCSFMNYNFLIYLLFFFSSGLTVMYSVRLFYYSMISYFSYGVMYNLYFFGYSKYLGMLFMTVMTILSGSLLSWLMFPVPSCIYLTLSLKLLITFIILMGVYLGYLISSLHFCSFLFMGYGFMKGFISLMWFMPIISTKLISYFPLLLGNNLLVIMEFGWLEYYGAQGVYNFIMSLIKNYLNLFDYNFSTYLMFFSLLFLLFLLLCLLL
uniref:NADH-ubiquinone oxidoreductase chain 5 n=1 Tax=Zhengitettix curvispinus TaxID=2793214 RepID=A0A7U3QC70_9ORTH|nr:NADH dehydrogenase subunit 5 [Zhengitettix curvispinus]